MYWYLYLTGNGSEDIKFDIGRLDTAMEAGGPMGPSRSRSQDSQDKKVLDGREPVEGHPNHIGTLPSSEKQMESGIGRELSAEQYTHKKGEPTPIEGQAV